MNEFSAARPFSQHFGEHYWAPGRGIDEKHEVFVVGTRMAAAAAALRAGQTLCIGELGFGTGLNLALALQTFAAHAPQDAHLEFYSCEAYPLAVADLMAIQAAWPPPLAEVLAPLRAAWPSLALGTNTVALGPFATLHLWLGEALEGLKTQDFMADCWWLDGFSPARNPAMWEDALLAQVAAHSKIGTRVATYSVARVVRERLQIHGFAVEKLTGVPPKRQRLTGIFSGKNSG